MDSSATLSSHVQTVPKSSLVLHDNNFPHSPATPFRFSGIPFSWEHLPGIPKKQNSKKNDSPLNLLPLPPLATLPTSKKFILEGSGIRKKNSCGGSFLRDPFLAALVECSKDDRETAGNFFDNAKVSRSLSDRFGFINLYTSSCKRTCAVSESIIDLRRSGRTSYDLINRRSR